jgi:hypothetical protein
VHEQRSCAAPSTLHQFCTPWQQLTPTTWHAGGQLSRRPIRWLAEEQSRLLNRRLCASAVGPDHLLASGAKDRAGGRLTRAPRAHRQLLPFALPISPRNATYLRVSLTRWFLRSLSFCFFVIFASSTDGGAFSGIDVAEVTLARSSSDSLPPLDWDLDLEYKVLLPVSGGTVRRRLDLEGGGPCRVDDCPLASPNCLSPGVGV